MPSRFIPLISVLLVTTLLAVGVALASESNEPVESSTLPPTPMPTAVPPTPTVIPSASVDDFLLPFVNSGSCGFTGGSGFMSINGEVVATPIVNVSGTTTTDFQVFCEFGPHQSRIRMWSGAGSFPEATLP